MKYRIGFLVAVCVVGLAFSWKAWSRYACKLVPMPWKTKEMVYASIRDLCHPQADDYLLLQTYLQKGNRQELAHLQGQEIRGFKIRLIEKDREVPQLQTVHVNNPAGKKENCLIVYCSLNKNFVGGLRRLVTHVANSDFCGDILYREGGWPNVEGGDLNLVHVPYAFKISFFKEAQRLGYKRALWLDTSVIPIVSLNQIFSTIEEKGYFVMGNGHTVGPYFNALAAEALGVALEKSFEIPSCSAGLFGIDFSHPQAVKAIERLYAAAHDRYAFFSKRWDQNALSVILYQLGMHEMVPYARIAESKDKIASDSLFLLDRGFVHDHESL
jgi:hypothetical protein